MKTNKTYIFFGLFILTVLLFIISFLNLLNSKRPLYKIFPPVYNNMNIILETKGEVLPDDILIKANENYYTLAKSRNLSNNTLHGKIETLDLVINKNFKGEIKDIIVFNDLKTNYFKDFSLFKKEDVEFSDGKINKAYIKYTFPDSVKYNKNSKSYNFHSINNLICNIFLLPFSFNIACLIPYIMLFISIVYYINNKKEIRPVKINPYLISAVLFIFGIFIYSNGMGDYLPWNDEYFSIEFSDPSSSLNKLFSDPGNPPLFYIIFRIFLSIFKISTLSVKVFPFIFGVLTLFFIWCFLKKRYDIKSANIGLLLAIINIPLVYYALEARSYIMQAMLTPLIVYSLFEILEKNDKKHYVIYTVLSVIAFNLHYYEILFLFSNFLFAVIYLLINKRYKDILKFVLCNFIAFLSFLPFFLNTALNKALIDSNFNNWIPDINFSQIKKCIFYITGGIFSLILSFVFFIKNALLNEDKKRKDMIIYSFLTITSTIAFGIILSYLIRPMLVERYLVLLSPLFIIFLVSIFTSKYKFKYIAVVFIIWVLVLQIGSFEKNNKRKGMIEIPLEFSKKYTEEKKPKNNIYTVTNISNVSYLNNKDKYIKDGIIYLSKSVKVIEEEINNILKNDKNAVIFTMLLETDEKNSKMPDNYHCYFNSSNDLCLWKITN